MIGVLSGVSDVKRRKQHFPLLKFLHFAFHCILVMKEWTMAQEPTEIATRIS